MASELNGLRLNAREFEPFRAEACQLGMYVFVYPALTSMARGN
jgi:hypothetical protein